MESPVLIDLTSCVTFTLPPPKQPVPHSTHSRLSDIYIALLKPNKLEMLIDLGRGIGF